MIKLVRFLCLTLVVSVLALLNGYSLHAQSNTLHSIYSNEYARDITWGSDSSLVSFLSTASGAAVEMPDPLWGQYTLATKQLTWNKRWPFQPTLTDREIQQFDIV